MISWICCCPWITRLLIQRDPTTRSANRYSLTHYHVRIDWPIADAAEDLAQSLRYISKDLYEKGDKYAELAQRKLFEYYGMPVMVGGRRTAAMVAAQYLKRIPCIYHRLCRQQRIPSPVPHF